MYKVLSLWIMIWVYIAATAQHCNITIKGKVADENSVSALADAAVVVVQTQQATITDQLGRFVLSNLCPGEITLAISHFGCKSELIYLQLTQDTTLRVKLNHPEQELEEITISSTKADNHSTQNTVQLQSTELEKLRGLTLGETIRKTTGVYSLNTGTTISKPVIHGLHSNRVLIQYNGVRLESQQWGSEHAPEVDPFVAEKITVIKGANSIAYGSDAVGGVILIDPNPLPVQHGISGKVNYAFFGNNFENNVSATLQGCHHKIPAFSWRVQGTFRRGGNAYAPGYRMDNTGVLEGNFSMAAGWKKPTYGIEMFFSRFETHIGIFSGAHIGNVSDLLTAIDRGTPLVQPNFTYGIGKPNHVVTHYMGKVRAYYQHKKAGDFSMTVAWQQNTRDEFDKSSVYITDKNRPAFHFSIQTITGDAKWSHRKIKRMSGDLGLQFITQTNNFKYAYLIPDFRNVGVGVYAIEKWTFKKIEIETGLRFDYRWAQYFVRNNISFDTTMHFYAPSANIGYEYHISDQITWRSNLGSAFRVPAPNELFADGVHHGAATYEIGNRYMKPEYGINLSSGLNIASKYLDLQLELYTNYVLNFINLIPVQPPTLTIRGSYPTFRFTQQDALLSGSDLLLTIKPVKNLDLFNKTSLLFARNVSSKDWLDQMPPLRTESGINFTINFERSIKSFYAGVSFDNVFKQIFTGKNSTDYAPAPKGYCLLNIEAGFVAEKNKQRVHVSVGLQNLTNKRYRDYLDRFRYYTFARGINGSVRITYEFSISEHKN